MKVGNHLAKRLFIAKKEEMKSFTLASFCYKTFVPEFKQFMRAQFLTSEQDKIL